MADEKPEKKDDAKAKGGEAPAAEKKKNALVPAIAAIAVLAIAGAGLGMYVAKVFTPAASEKPAAEAAKGEGHGEEGGEAADPHGGGTAAKGGHGTGLLATGSEIDPIPLKANVTGSGGTRYVTLTVSVWVPVKEAAELKEASVRRLIQAKLEEQLKTYQLEDLQSPSITARMKKDFGTAVNRLARSLKPERKEDVVLELAITELLTQ